MRLAGADSSLFRVHCAHVVLGQATFWMKLFLPPTATYFDLRQILGLKLPGERCLF